jgi:hypothetical protein
LASPADPEWTVHRRGELREGILRDWREGLRVQIDPETLQPVTESVIQQTTMKGSRFFREADALDLVGLGIERRDQWFVQQIHIDRASTAFLDSYHGKTWGTPRLPAFGGSGTVTAEGIEGTTWQGSTTVPDAFANVLLDGANNRYQVLVTGSADADEQATLTVVGIDGGDETNLGVGATLRWESPPPGSTPSVTVLTAFRGGLDAETDAAYAKRLFDRARHKPASGNWAHIRTYARAASVSVEDAFVYTCAFHAGSELVAVVQKRGTEIGPLARIPEIGVLNAVKTALVPPASPFVPGRVHVVVLPPVAQSCNMVLLLAQPFGTATGWRDIEPFPPVGAGAIAITTLTNQQDFRVTTSGAGQLPRGASSATNLHLMVWDVATSSFHSLAVDTITDLGGGQYRVQLIEAPADHTLALGDWISPDMERRDVLGDAVNAYFDNLGPGEIINLSTDERSGRAFRNPIPSEEYPQRAGQGVLSFVGEALGTPVADSQLLSASPSTPTVPADPIDGPSLLVAGKLAVYHLE